MWLTERNAWAQQENSVAIQTNSVRDSLIFRVRLDGITGFRLYFEDQLQAELPPFDEKYFAIKPQRNWSCIGTRDAGRTVDIIIYADCEKAKDGKLKTFWKAEDVPVTVAKN